VGLTHGDTDSIVKHVNLAIPLFRCLFPLYSFSIPEYFTKYLSFTFVISLPHDFRVYWGVFHVLFLVA
jgi:hypothetical protein